MTQAPRQTLSAPIRRIRFVYVALFFCAWVVVIALRLGWLQVVRHGEFVERADRQQQRTFEVAPRRGMLYDRNMRALAMTVLADSVYAVPSEMEDKAAAADALARVVHLEPEDKYTTRQEILERLNNSRNFAWVARKLRPDVADEVRALHIKGVYFQKEFKRYYPNNDMVAQVLGYVGTDDKGLGGMERAYEKELHGVPGRMLTAIDARRHIFGSVERDPQPGTNLMLTIDANIQYIAETALDHAMEKTKALSGVIVIQDPHTGQILALAIRPTFNPNDFRHADPRSLRDIAVSNVYEPGSTFKLVTYSAAIDATGVQPTDIVDCQGGQIVLFGRTIHDDISDRGLGKVTIATALARSSDVAAVKMALRLGKERFYDYIHAFGFGQRTGVELPAETRGLLKKPNRWEATSIGSIAIGQEVAVTPVQLVSMVSTIANGGVYLPPHILMQTNQGLKDGDKMKPEPFRPEVQLPSPLPEGSRRVISELTAARMRQMMEGIVLNGTGRPAALNGYSAGGKTGTAQKIDVVTHTYSKTQHIASFAGIAPINNPAISVVIVIDSPKGAYYGTAVAAPIFHEVAQNVLEYLGVPHDEEVKTPKLLLASAKQMEDEDDAPQETPEDLDALFSAVNELPADDPLRSGEVDGAALAQKADDARLGGPEAVSASLSKSVVDTYKKDQQQLQSSGNLLSSDADRSFANRSLPPPLPARPDGSVVVNAGKLVPVPSLTGKDLRHVIEAAATAGLKVHPVGSGLAREQVPAAGTMVPTGTEIVVRLSR
jgi:cell division protein FtsI (penicillin-binding protein 3)